MSSWSNIEISPHDIEVNEIDKLEKTLGEVSGDVQKIRELITRFEVCHFKYQQHFKYINDSIIKIKPSVNPTQIGTNHIRNGKDVVSKDKSGRSILGQQYLNSLRKWLGDSLQENSNYINDVLNQRITKWLGDINPDKERLVRLLISRLIWDWNAYEEYRQTGEYKELETQACRMDICHYAFPRHLDLLIQGIGKIESIINFDGCGSFNFDIKTYVEKQFSILYDYLKSNNKKSLGQEEKIKFWLIACLAKTLKEQVGLNKPLHQLIGFKS